MTAFAIHCFPTMWGPYNDPREVIHAPVGLLCLLCEKPIRKEDYGLTQFVQGEYQYCAVLHRECFLRQVLGSARNVA